MKIAILQAFLPSRSQGGVGHFADQFANRLVTRGHEVTVFSLDPAPSDAHYDVVQPVAHVRYLRGRLGRTYGFALWLARQDYRTFDLIHAMGDNQFLRTAAPVVRTVSGSALGEARHARKLTTRLMQLSQYPLELLGVARAGIAVGISRNSCAHFPWVQRVIPQGIDLDTFHPGNQKSSVPAVLFVGHRLYDRKRAYLLVDAFMHTVRPALPEAELWLVCDDSVSSPGVRCFTNLPVNALAGLYRRAWVFCLPSSYEGFGRPYAEAMASGTPVVATPNPGAAEVLENGRYGLVVAPEMLGHELVALLGAEERRRQLADAGLRRAAGFDWRHVVAQYEAVYSIALQKRMPATERRSCRARTRS